SGWYLVQPNTTGTCRSRGADDILTRMRHAATMRFGLMSLAGTPEDVIADARLAADAGFDVIATADHLRHPRDPQVPGLDGWSILAAWAVTTERLRLAMLVSNLIYRHPVVLAKQVITVDQLS